MRVLIAYSDVPSARHALARVTAHIRDHRRHAEIHPLFWRFNQLDDPRWRETALSDAARADALVLAMSHEEAFCARTEAWVDALLARTRGASLNVLAVIGDSEPWTITLAQPAISPAPAAVEDPPPSAAAAPPEVEVFASVTPRKLAACAA